MTHDPSSTASSGGKRVVIEALRSGQNTLSKEAAHYVRRVLRMNTGDEFTAIDPRHGVEAHAVVTLLGRHAVIEVGTLRQGTERGVVGLHLVQALGKGQKLERVLKDAVALGVDRLSVVLGERSVARPSVESGQGNTNDRKARWLDIAVDVARQCGRSDVPEIAGPSTFEAVSDAAAAGQDFVLLPGSPSALSQFQRVALAQPASRAQPWRLWVGPEGGFSKEETTRLTARGALPCSLGPLVLRTELAAGVALSLAAAVLRESFPDKVND